MYDEIPHGIAVTVESTSESVTNSGEDIFNIDATKADIVDGILRISIPKKAEFVSKVIKDFAPEDTPAENA